MMITLLVLTLIAGQQVNRPTGEQGIEPTGEQGIEPTGEQGIEPTGEQGIGPTGHQGLNERGAHVMGFDQDATVHHFRLHADGGSIDIAAKDRNDATSRDAIRSHLPHIASMFGDGNFEAPMLIHETNVPGTDRMAALKNRIRFVYVETPVGGRLDVFTTDKEALAAVHDFMRFQITDHKTGDPLTITKR